MSMADSVLPSTYCMLLSGHLAPVLTVASFQTTITGQVFNGRTQVEHLHFMFCPAVPYLTWNKFKYYSSMLWWCSGNMVPSHRTVIEYKVSRWVRFPPKASFCIMSLRLAL